MFDAYTVKKVVPRLVAAAILIQLSWPIFTYLIFVVGQIAWGIEGLLYAPFGGSEMLELKNILAAGTDINVITSGGVLILSGVVGGLALGLLGLLSLLGTVLLGLLIAFFVLAVRQVVLVVLLVTAPVALVAWILPNTEKVWKLWWESFSKLLFMYPLILFLIAGGKIAAYLVATSEGINTGNAGFRVAIILIAFFAPYFLVPATFKVAGSAFANITGLVNDRGKGAFDRLKQYRGKKTSENWQKTKGFSRFEGNNKLTRGINTALGGAAAGPTAWKGGRAGISAARETGRVNAGAAWAESNAVFQANKNNDQFLLALANENLAKKKMADAEASGDTAMAAGYRQALAQAALIPNKGPEVRGHAALALAATGYQFDTGQAGYNQLAETMAGVTGAQLTYDSEGNVTGATGARAGDFAAQMNGAQFYAKNAGRFDLAGINYGAGYDAETGLGKADPYTLATRAKPDAIKAKGQLMRGSLAKALEAKESGDMKTYKTEMDKAAVHKLELQAVQQSATGKNRDTAISEVSTIDGVNELNEYITGDPSIRERARGARRPDPSTLDDINAANEGE